MSSSRATLSIAALSGGNSRAIALSLNACPYLATSSFPCRPQVPDSIEATTILPRRANLKAETFEEIVELFDWYRCRWEIETFFNVLKNGCCVEALQLGHLTKIELALAVYMVVWWRLARLVRLGRTHPELEATALFTAEDFFLKKPKVN